LHGSTNYNKAKYINFQGPCWGGQTAPQGCNLIGTGGALFQDLSGQPTANAPLWTATLGLDYESPITAAFLGGISLNANYYSSSNASAFHAPLAEQSAYVSLDASLRVLTSDRKWQLCSDWKKI